LTQGGLNDALIVDFLSLTGETMPRIARARMLSPNGGPLHESTVFDFREREEPFRLVFPFESFVPRRGLVNVPPIDFERIETVEVAFGSHFLETRGQVEQWQMKLDRIWVGPASAIPEPRGIVIAFVVVACCASWLFRCFLRRKRSCSL
jgi:hypothetical protein